MSSTEWVPAVGDRVRRNKREPTFGYEWQLAELVRFEAPSNGRSASYAVRYDQKKLNDAGDPDGANPYWGEISRLFDLVEPEDSPCEWAEHFELLP